MRPRLLALITFLLTLSVAIPVRAQLDDATRQLSRDIFKQLIEINTTDSVGSTTVAAEAMAKRLRDAGFPASDIFVGGPNSRKGNVVARLHGTGAHRPVLFICHLDVVEARREDWSMDPFVLHEQDGYFYGRGTLDVKSGDVMLVVSLIQLKQEGYKPDRDIIVALTADEEGGAFNGVDWLLRNHRELIDAEFIINPDGGSFQMVDGRRILAAVQASEKQYQDFELKVTNRGGHSSQPVADNAIYHLADGLARLQQYTFPFELNEITRAYYSRMAGILGGSIGADMRAILQTPPDEPAMARLSEKPFYNGIMRTTCVATRLDAGHANNALPQMAKAIVNCRILPGHTPEEVQATLVKVLDDPKISVTPIFSGVAGGNTNPASPLRPDVIGPFEKTVAQMWPGVPVVPVLETGASDGAISRAAGIPTYGISGVWMDVNDDRSHGRDERILVSSFYEGVDFFNRFMKALSSPE